MNRRTVARALILAAALLSLAGAALADNGSIRTYLTFRVTTPTQSSVVNVGQDLQIEVGIEGVEPTSYEWFFNDEKILENGDQRIYNILNAQVEDAGIYRMQAYVNEAMALSVDVNVRVIDTSHLPDSGDESLPVVFAFGAAGIALAAMALLVRKRQAA